MGPKDKLSTGDTGHKESVVVLTTEQLQKIVSSIQTSNQSQQSVEEKPQGNVSGDVSPTLWQRH